MGRKARIARSLFVWIMVVFLFSALWAGFSVSAQTEHKHDDIEWQEWTNATSLPSTAGNYYLTADVTISSTWNVPSGTTNLCLNDHKIAYGGSSGSVIRINSGATLNLFDCGTTEHYYYIGAASTYNSNCLGAIVASESDTNYVNAERRGSFFGGYITGGYGTNYSSPGSTVFGGGVFVDGGTFVLNGGCIFGNRLSVRDGGNGGGGVAVRKASSSFVMNGGYIIGNHAGRFGGGIRIDGGSFTMNGGEIRHNTANTPGSGGAGCGGGLHLGGLDGGATVTITGGIIEGNYAGLKDGRGGGINVAGGTLSMTGGTVIGNNATLSGGGVNGPFSLSGNVTITGNTVGGTFVADSYTLTGGTVNNVYLSTGQTITIANAVTTGADIGITLDSVTGTFTSGWKTAMGDADPANYFTSNNGDYKVLLKNGEAEIGLAPHEHDDITFAKWTSTNSLPNTAGNYYLTADVTISSTWNVPSGTTNLCLCGHGIRMSGYDSVIKIGEGRTLKLYDCNTETEHRYSIAYPAANGAGVATVNDALTGNYQTFTGGYITGGYITGGYRYGAGINLEGSGATLYMYGGTIIGNRLTAGSTGGGGVCVQDWDKSGGFYMYGGSIIGNTSNYGGGVYVRTGRMELIGGTISKNVANGNIGGGVLVFGGGSTLVVQGGAIGNNTAEHGGAVEASGDGTVIISGGSFTNNLATGRGGALTNQRTDGSNSPASFNISGAPVFSGNTAGGQASDIYLCNTAVLNLTAEMTNTTAIGITRAAGVGTFTSGWSDYMDDDADPADYFTSDNGSYVVKLDASGEAKIAPPHTHSWSYTVNGNVITASCTGDGTCDLTSQTVTITANGKTYDGTAVTATVTKSDNWDAYGLTAPGEISYSGNTNAGTYTASVTVGSATATISFTIERKTEKTVDDGDTGVTVDGLDSEIKSIEEENPDASSVSVVMTVESKTEETASNAAEIQSAANKQSLEFFEIKIEKTVDSVTTSPDTTTNVLEIAIPYAKTDKKDITVYAYHGTEVRIFEESDSKENRTFRVDKENGIVYIYTNSFSTYAIGYTPYYRVNSSISLGSFDGKVTVTLKNQNGETIFTFENVAMGSLQFENMPSGQYTMTVTWIDGVENTLVMPLTIGAKSVPAGEIAEAENDDGGAGTAPLKSIEPAGSSQQIVSVAALNIVQTNPTGTLAALPDFDRTDMTVRYGSAVLKKTEKPRFKPRQ